MLLSGLSEFSKQDQKEKVLHEISIDSSHEIFMNIESCSQNE